MDNNNDDIIVKTLDELKDQKLALENKLAETRDKKKEHKRVRNLYFFRNTAELALPFVLSGGVISGLVGLAGGGAPFIKDNMKKAKEYIFECHSEDDVNLNERYVTWDQRELFIENKDVVVYSPWEKKDDLYVRTKTSYKVDDKEVSFVNDYLSNNFKFIDNDTINYDIEYQTTNIIDEDNNKGSIKAYLKYYDTDDFIYERESNLKNIIITISELLGTAVVGGIITLLVNNTPYSDFKEQIELIKTACIEEEEYKEKLEKANKNLLSLSNKKGGR